GHAKANRGTLARGDAGLRLLGSQTPARTGIDRRPALGDGGLALGFEVGGRAETVIRAARGEELGGERLIEMQALRHAVRSARAADVRPFIPVEAEPPQIPQDGVLGLARRSLLIAVLDAE